MWQEKQRELSTDTTISHILIPNVEEKYLLHYINNLRKNAILVEVGSKF